MAWEQSTTNTVPRADAISLIGDKARAEGHNGAFKVVYDGREVVSPSDLPADVDMTKVRIASVMNQA